MKKEKPLHLLLKPDSWWNMHHTLWITPWDQKGNLSQTMAANGSQLGAPGGRRLPRKFWHPRKSKLPEWPERALLLCSASTVQAEHPRAHISWEQQQEIPLTYLPLLCGGQAHHHITQRVHLCTHFISTLQILAPAPPSVHFLVHAVN